MTEKAVQNMARLAGIMFILVSGASGCSRTNGAAPGPGIDTDNATADVLAAGFSRVDGPQALNFPADDGPHPAYLTEWWYYTGNLDTADGRHFGFQLTFFRRGALPPGYVPQRESAWAADQIYLAHFALTDVSGNAFHAAERFSRGAAGLAGAQSDPYRVWLDDWTVEAAGSGDYRLYAREGEITIELTLADDKGRILHGDAGYSRKGPDPGNASIYISHPRLAAEGTIEIGGDSHSVAGLAWMDHEYSTSALGPDEVGWDWFSVQLDDGSELMLFQLRQTDGGISPYSSATLIEPDGSAVHLEVGDFTIAVTDRWTSPQSGADYPAGWTIDVPDFGIRLEIEPYAADQELQVSFVYWEGAVRVAGTRDGRQIAGAGYVELTGYAHSMQGEF